MKNPAYYNEFDKNAAQWLRNLMEAGHIAPGFVDERSIEDVKPDDLREFTQCHFFAGIGVWSYALRRIGWPDDRRIWTGSCPCQPFSQTGKGSGFADERHLWPAFHYLISVGKPDIVGGEQVASPDGAAWLDLVHTDMEALGYAFGALAFPAAGVGAPHIRDRTYWLAHANQSGLEGRPVLCECGDQLVIRPSGMANRMADTNMRGSQRQPHAGPTSIQRCAACTFSAAEQPSGIRPSLQHGRGPTNGHWRDADWLGCTDGKWRSVEPGTFPLATGVTSSMGPLRAYGNAINAEAAVEFLKASLTWSPK